MPGVLYLCATPIGNLGDATARLRQTLSDVDVVYAEDTRRSGRLLAAMGVDAELHSYFVGNEAERSKELAEHLRTMRDVALVTDAGTPGVSDPGVSAVRAARSVGAEVRIIPGPSAVTAAIALSGFGGDRFAFEGFLPRKGRIRAARIQEVASDTRPTVIFTAANRLVRDLEDLMEAGGAARQVCVVRELTKMHEEVWWGPLDEAVEYWSEVGARGEVTVVIAGGQPAETDLASAVEMARAEMEAGATRSAAARSAAARSGQPRRAIYEELG